MLSKWFITSFFLSVVVRTAYFRPAEFPPVPNGGNDLPFDKCVSMLPLKQIVFPFHETSQFLITEKNFEMLGFPTQWE